MRQEIWFHKYRIIKLLGKGSNANVYLAEHILLNSYRAIKCLSKDHPLYNLQLKEAFLLKNLKHPCIPIIYDIEEDDDGSYIVEQYLEGETLKEYVETRGTIRENIIIQFGLQLCDLIHYLHSIDRPILYLDLKPENIIISEATLKLIDFGSAIYQDEVREEQEFYATRGYAAPELYHHNKVDERCDVYSIGMLLYYMASGIKINHDFINFQNIDQICECSRQLKTIINRCLKFSPSQRYANVTQLGKQLSGIIRRKKLHFRSSHSLRIALAGAQPRIGVTHFSFRICSYFIHRKRKCVYEEKNNSGCAWMLRQRYDDLSSKDGIYQIHGIPVLPKHQGELPNTENYPYRILDYGCLSKENLEDFLDAEVKILVLGAKEWELGFAEQVLELLAEYKDILYFFNFLDGRQFQQVLKNMEGRSCYRIPYDPDPFSKMMDKNGLELYHELTGIMGI